MKTSSKAHSRNIRLNLSRFTALQGDLTEGDMAEKLKISRSHLWRIKKRNSSVGEEFIAKFIDAYPCEQFDHYFFVEGVEKKQQCCAERSES